MRRMLTPLLLLVPLLVPLLVAGPGAGPAAAQTAPDRPTTTVTLADDGRTVTLRPGASLAVSLAPTAGTVWQGLERGAETLHLVQHRTDERDGLRATLHALSPGRYGGRSEVRPQTLTAVQESRCERQQPACPVVGRQWSVQVVVEDGPADTSELACRPTARPTVSPAPGTVTITTADDGRTVTVPRDGRLVVQLDGGCTGEQWTPPRAGAPLFREAASVERERGLVDALFTPQATGTTTVTATLDARCLHRTDASGDGTCAVGQRAYSVTVQVGDATPAPATCSERLTLTGPARAVAGSTAVLSGRAVPGATVRVLFRRYGQAEFAVRRTLTAGPDGAVSTSWTVGDDHRWYAEDGSCSTAPGLTKAAPRVVGPAVVRRGETVTLRVQAVAGVRTTVFFRGAGEPFSARRTLTGPGTVTYTATRDQRYYALTRDTISNHGLTQVR